MSYRFPATSSVRDGLLALAGSVVEDSNEDYFDSLSAARMELEMLAATEREGWIAVAWEIDLDEPENSQMIGYRVVFEAD